MLFAVTSLAAVRHLTYKHPDSMDILRSGCDDYAPLVLNGVKQPRMVTHRMLNGLLVHLKKTPHGYEPVLGVYMNAEGARVHMEDKNGIAAVHSHTLIPEYELGSATLAGIQATMRQIPPGHYEKGPSRFLLRFAKRFKKGRLFGHMEHAGKIIAVEQEAIVLNSNHRGLVFPNAFTDYPKGSELHVRFELDKTKTTAVFPFHELPPKETLSRTLFQEKGARPRFE